MSNKKPNKNQINRVRRKADEQDITLGGKSNLPEDETHGVRRRGGKLETTHHRRVSHGEQENIRKGRPPKQEKIKTPVDRHRPRKSELEKKYTHELQKLRNRLRYREKQGFFVKWETAPSRVSRVTLDEIEKLKQYDIRLNDSGEIEMYRKEYSKYADEIPKKLRLKYTDLPNYSIENDPNFIPPPESVQNWDIFEDIETRFMTYINLVQVEGTQVDHPMNEDVHVALSMSVEQAYREVYDRFKQLRDSPLRQQYADYLTAHESEVLQALEILLYVSEEDQIDGAKSELLIYIEMH